MLNSLADVQATLPELQTSMQRACDWLINVAQVTTDQIESSSNPRGLRHEYWKGAFRGEYLAASQQWDVFCPVWHGGQAVKALCLAYEVTNDPRYLETAKAGAQFIIHNQITEGPDTGLILGYEDIPDQVNTAAVLECLDGLFHLSRTTNDPQYNTAAIAAATWCRDHAWVKGRGLVHDRYDPNTHQIVDVTISKDNRPGRPLADDAVWLTAHRLTGDQSFREVFYEILEQLLRDENPEGNWAMYVPCNLETGEIHPRHGYWWGKPMLDAWLDSKEQRWLDAAQRSGQWYIRAQRSDGGLFRFTSSDFKTACFGQATSGIVCAASMWIELFKHTGQTVWLEPTRKALEFTMSMQFTEPADPNLKGCILEKVLPPDGTDRNPYRIRDLGTIFFIQAAAQLILAGSS